MTPLYTVIFLLLFIINDKYTVRIYNEVLWQICYNQDNLLSSKRNDNITEGEGMKAMKKSRILVFILVFAMMFTACGKGNTNTGQNDNTQAQTTQAPVVTEEAAVTEELEPTDEPTQAPEDTAIAQAPMPDSSWSEDMQEMRDITAIDLVKEIKIGWNLGNTMDVTGNSTLAAETAWGNPMTTKDMVDAVKAAGFNTIRIPTTWEPHLGKEPDYKIDPLWLKRVQEIVDYAMANDMYVILNAHHDEWYMPLYSNKDRALEMMEKVWSQIAYRFQNYDEHLIFEGMNEPRQKGTKDEWNGGNEEGWDMINQLNAKFVETIRNSGGNNPSRILIITPYGASSSGRAWAKFEIPEDDKLIVSIHAYTPYNFALNKTGIAEWSSDNTNDTREIDSLVDNIYNKFISNGIPVILGEFGAMNKNGNTAARVDWAEYYVSKAAEKGIPCIWWDNGAFEGNGENFGLLNRFDCTWRYPEVVEALMKGLE